MGKCESNGGDKHVSFGNQKEFDVSVQDKTDSYSILGLDVKSEEDESCVLVH